MTDSKSRCCWKEKTPSTGARGRGCTGHVGNETFQLCSVSQGWESMQNAAPGSTETADHLALHQMLSGPSFPASLILAAPSARHSGYARPRSRTTHP